eukprot:NODE_11786_length_457_cov_30.436364_g11763_i0.p1 GENE.NODE_11786_length_457_cov_30.436364_g11763_i0~~NODE_11786_length_457_cov_30.436364_g11763_i0.p1  ORF type:complete len:104 (+),score=15.59 NODE_11786_length_457_cov_30.436364_g11763_i0:71-382(+)
MPVWHHAKYVTTLHTSPVPGHWKRAPAAWFYDVRPSKPLALRLRKVDTRFAFTLFALTSWYAYRQYYYFPVVDMRLLGLLTDGADKVVVNNFDFYSWNEDYKP